MTEITSHEGAALDAALSRLDITVENDEKLLLMLHLRLLENTNKRMNLTRIVDFEQAITYHIEDSLAVLPEFSDREGRFCDIGTGGGFPGIPLAIVSGRPGVLIDSVKKKATAVQEFIVQLGLQDRLEARGLRSEELSRESPHSFDTVVARAVSSLPSVEELATPLLRQGGRLVALRGHEDDESIEASLRAAEILGLELVSQREYSVGADEAYRSVFVFERSGNSSIAVPRRVGLAQKRPLGK